MNIKTIVGLLLSVSSFAQASLTPLARTALTAASQAPRAGMISRQLVRSFHDLKNHEYFTALKKEGRTAEEIRKVSKAPFDRLPWFFSPQESSEVQELKKALRITASFREREQKTAFRKGIGVGMCLVLVPVAFLAYTGKPEEKTK